MNGVRPFEDIAGTDIFQQSDGGDALDVEVVGAGFAVDNVKFFRLRVLDALVAAMGADGVNGDGLRLRLEIEAPLRMAMDGLQGFKSDGGMDEGLAFLGVELPVHQQMSLMAWLFGLKVRPESAGANPAWSGAKTESFSGRCQKVGLGPGCFSGHGNMIIGGDRDFNGKMRQN